jgi:hypothetical protein
MTVTSVRQAAAVCNVTPPVVRRWLSLGLIPTPPWTLQQLHQVRLTDPHGRRRGPQAAHGTLTRWLEGCDCDGCHKRRTPPQGHASGGERKRGYPSRCASNSSTRSTAASRSARCSASSASPPTRCGGSPRPTRDGRRRLRPPDGNPPDRPRARHQRRVRPQMRLQGVPGAPARPHGQEPLTPRLCRRPAEWW